MKNTEGCITMCTYRLIFSFHEMDVGTLIVSHWSIVSFTHHDTGLVREKSIVLYPHKNFILWYIDLILMIYIINKLEISTMPWKLRHRSLVVCYIQPIVKPIRTEKAPIKILVISLWNLGVTLKLHYKMVSLSFKLQWRYISQGL